MIASTSTLPRMKVQFPSYEDEDILMYYDGPLAITLEVDGQLYMLWSWMNDDLDQSIHTWPFLVVPINEHIQQAYRTNRMTAYEMLERAERLYYTPEYSSTQEVVLYPLNFTDLDPEMLPNKDAYLYYTPR